jgi:hypothetical protein
LDLGSTAIGTAIASKAVILDSNKDYTGIRNLTSTGIIQYGSLSDGTITITAFVDEDDMSSNSATLIPTQQSVKAYVDSSGGSVSGNTFATDLKIGRDADNLIDFSTDNIITFRVNQQNIGSFSESGDGNFIIKPIVDAKDIIFQQRDGTEVARVEDNGTFNVVADKLAINGTAITATAAEINVLDGITAVVGELNALDLGSTAIGTAIASKAVILDSNKDYTGIRNLTISGELDAATLDISGNADIDGTLTIGADDNGEAIFTRLTHSDEAGGKLSIKAGSATGTNKSGGDLDLYGGIGTGDTTGGNINFYSHSAGNSGTSAGTSGKIATLNYAGHLLTTGNVFPKLVAKTYSGNNVTYDKEDMIGGIIIRTASSSLSDTTDSASNIIGAIPNAIIGSSFRFIVINKANGNISLSVGNNITFDNGGIMAPYNISINGGNIFEFLLVCTNVDTPAATIYRLNSQS